jgi:hypothetical protein
MPIPTRKQWQDTKKKYGVPDGAVSGINLGQEIDKYWKSNTAKEQAAALTVLETKLNTYITKIDKKKIKQYPAFEKDFLNNYLGQAHFMREDLKRYAANAEVYKKELMKFFTAVQKLDKQKSTEGDLQKFRSGPVRGLTAMGKNLKGGYDTRQIDGWLGTMDAAVLKLNKPSQQQIAGFVDATIKTAGEIQKAAKAQGLL